MRGQMPRPSLTSNPLPPSSRDTGKVKGDGVLADPSSIDNLFKKVVGVEARSKSLKVISQGAAVCPCACVSGNGLTPSPRFHQSCGC